MIALIYLKSNHKIIIKVDDVISYTSTDVIGENGSAKGIDLTLADFVIVESTVQEVGHALTDFTDLRSEVPPSPEEQIRQLQETVSSLQAQLNG